VVIESKEFYVSERALKDMSEGVFFGHSARMPLDVKITVTWEKQDRVVTITESEFDAALKRTNEDYSSRSTLDSMKFMDILKEQLFKDKA
jgi:hypothetical protein